MINLCFSSCQLSCASFAINTIKDPTEVGNVMDSICILILQWEYLLSCSLLMSLKKTNYSVPMLIRQSMIDFLLLWSFHQRQQRTAVRVLMLVPVSMTLKKWVLLYAYLVL